MNTKNLDHDYNNNDSAKALGRLSLNSELQSSDLFTGVSSPSISLSSLNDQKQAANKQYQINEKENNHFMKSPPNVIAQRENAVKYGELVLLGYNGCIKHPTTETNSIKSGSIYSTRRKSKFTLLSKEKANGVKPALQVNYHSKQEFNNAISKTDRHSVTYTLSRTHQVIVEYVPDANTDMFQIGRSAESAIDFIVLDTHSPTIMTGADPVLSTISRYSCRIVVDREFPYTARIYAAGFDDSSKRIFLGEKANPWKNDDGTMDGVTTNGVLILHPPNGFYTKDSPTNKHTNEWMEVSLCGAVIKLKENRLTPPSMGNKKLNNKGLSNMQSNILRDGTLIDLCGATLLWRSTDSLANTVTKECLEKNLEYLNNLRPQCPVGFRTLVFPSSASPASTGQNNNPLKSISIISHESMSCHTDRTPMVYLKCGHIHGQHDWGIRKDNERECPLCRKVGPYVKLLIGIEPSFYCDYSNPKDTPKFKPYAFLPCGHMASEMTCRFWSQIEVPEGMTQVARSMCPFCAVALCEDQPIVKLIIQEGL